MYVAQNPIRAFDDVQKLQSDEAVHDLDGTTESLQEYIDFGKDWRAANSLRVARRQYEQRKALREFAAREEDNRWTEEPS